MTVRQHRLSDPPYPSDYIYPADKDYPLNEDWEGGPIALLDTSEGLNNQAWHLTYLTDAPPAPYNPDMMQYTPFAEYSKTSVTTTGNKLTQVGRFKADPRAGAGSRYFLLIHTGTANSRRLLVSVQDTSHAFGDQIEVQIRNSSGTALFTAHSLGSVTDGQEHVYFVAFDGDTGTGIFIIDDVAQTIDVSTIGTVNTGSQTVEIGGSQTFGGAFYDGLLGYVGYKDDYLTNWSDFMDGSQPKLLDTTTWTEWSGQPALFHGIGDMVLNLGTEGAMTKSGTITQVPADPIPGVFQGFQVTPEDTGDPISVLSGVNSVQCGLGFDQNAHVTIAWIDSFGAMHLYWFDTTVGDWVVTNYGSGFGGVGLTLDDKRFRQTGASDVLLWYTLPVGDHHEVYTREQRDRYAIEYPMEPGLPTWAYFKKLGMADKLRVQMTMTNVGPV